VAEHPRRGGGPWRAALIGTGAAALGALAGSLAPGGERRQPPLNVVMILVDTLRADHLGMYGYARPTSPRLDAWAATGVRFAEARAQAGCTSPSVNSILTSRSPGLFLGQPDERLGFLDDSVTLQEILRARGYRTIAVSASPVVRKTPSHHNKHGRFDRGFDVFEEACLRQDADCVTQLALGAIDRRAESQPFLLYAHYLDPHDPYEPAERFRRRFVKKRDRLSPWAAEGNLRPLQRFLYGGGPKVEFGPQDIEHSLDLYDAEIQQTDRGIHRLFEGLEARDLLEGTIVVLLADHGEEFLEHGGIHHCRTTYDETVKTPLVFVGPGIQPRVVGMPVENLDVVPTILDLLGVSANSEGFEGRSLSGLLRGASGAARAVFSAQGVYRAAIDGRYKLILNSADRKAVLYDLVSDPRETVDRSTEERPAFRRLWAVLAAHLEATEGGIGTRRSLDAAAESERVLKALGYL
jgi:arylsulfatase